jgi:hypothetical protein
MRKIERTGQFKRDYKRESKGQPLAGPCPPCERGFRVTAPSVFRGREDLA